MYCQELKTLIKAVVNGTMPISEISQRLIADVNCVKIYDSEDLLVTDAYFTLKHFLNEEEIVEAEERLYFIKCFEG